MTNGRAGSVMVRRYVVLGAITTALVVGAGAGGAVGARLVTTTDIKNETISSDDIHRNAVGTSEVANGSMRSADLSASLRAAISEAGEPGPRAMRARPDPRDSRARRANRARTERTAPMASPATR